MFKPTCRTCNYRNFEKVSIEENGRVGERLESSLGYGDLIMSCNLNGTDYFLEIKNAPKSSFRLYHCPTCGRNLF
jgi:hypothetical protein